MPSENEDAGSLLMKMVEAIAITPQAARIVVQQYKDQAKQKAPNLNENEINKIICKKIIDRYSKMAAASGAATAMPGAVPGVGTALSMIGGGLVDISVCMKLQVDMTMCLAVAINGEMSNEDAKHMSFIIALFGTLEQMSSGATAVAGKASARMVYKYLSGATLSTIKELFAKVGISFTQKATAKAIPFGVGILIGGSANYYLTKYVGNIARDTFLIDLDEKLQST